MAWFAPPDVQQDDARPIVSSERWHRRECKPVPAVQMEPAYDRCERPGQPICLQVGIARIVLEQTEPALKSSSPSCQGGKLRIKFIRLYELPRSRT